MAASNLIDFGPGIGPVADCATAFGMLALFVDMPPSPVRELYLAVCGDSHRRHAVDEFGSWMARNLASAYQPGRSEHARQAVDGDPR